MLHLDDAGIKRAAVLSAYSFSNPSRKNDYEFVRATTIGPRSKWRGIRID